MCVDFYSHSLEFLFKEHCRSLTFKACNYYFVAFDVIFGEVVDHLQNIRVVADTKVSTYLSLLNISCIYTYYDIQVFLKTLEYLHLRVWIKTGKNTGSMKVMKEFPSTLYIESSLAFMDSFQNITSLFLNIFLAVKAYFVHDCSKIMGSETRPRV